MKQIIYLLAFSTVISVYGQSEDIKTLLKIEDNTYFADRDSAYADPYYGIKKLIYGNKRFVDDRRVSPRQSDGDLKNSSLGQ